MFLNYLERGNKKRFLDICVHAAMSDGNFVKEEKEMMAAYCREMNIPEYIPEENESLETILNDFVNNSSDVERKIVLTEILGLVKADNAYTEKEKEFMEKLAAKMCIEAGVLDKINSLLDIYNLVCKELFTTIVK
ncbi:MAG: hypothetical protein Q4F03_00060 [Eubacteriales bacterium]|nr:hypothetical protein [Eubacteriales bacterium]